MQNKILVITTGEIGMRHQALGLANALGNDICEQTVSLGSFWNRLPGHWVPEAFIDLPELEIGTNVIITCGRRSTPFSLALKKHNPEVFTIHIQNPQIPLNYFDLVVPMQHDNCKGENVFSVTTALHHLTKQDLQTEAKNFADKLNNLPKKKIAIILGGNTKDFSFTVNKLNEVVQIYTYLKQQGFGVLLTTARRTPSGIVEKLKALQTDKNDWFYFNEGENPYKCFLAEADGFIMTSDSVSMVSEALFTGKPVYLIDLEGRNKRIESFKENLLNTGYARTWQDEFKPYNYVALDSKIDVANKVNQLITKR